MTLHSAQGRFAQGFTLIEVMIVVAIIGILAAIAYPSYIEHVRHSRRAEAQTALLETAQFMQRFYAANNRYDKDLSGDELEAKELPKPSAPNLAYTIGFAKDSLTSTAFKLEAVPTAGGLMESDKCGTLTLDQTGVRAIHGRPDGSTATAADCWK